MLIQIFVHEFYTTIIYNNLSINMIINYHSKYMTNIIFLPLVKNI